LLRVQRLASSESAVPVAIAAYTASVAILVVPTVAVAVPWLTELSRLFSAA
jgi:hypothetical protein